MSYVTFDDYETDWCKPVELTASEKIDRDVKDAQIRIREFIDRSSAAHMVAIRRTLFPRDYWRIDVCNKREQIPVHVLGGLTFHAQRQQRDTLEIVCAPHLINHFQCGLLYSFWLIGVPGTWMLDEVILSESGAFVDLILQFTGIYDAYDNAIIVRH